MKMDVKKIILDKYPSYLGKTKFVNVIFLMNFVRLPPEEEYHGRLGWNALKYLHIPSFLQIQRAASFYRMRKIKNKH
jgi:hypothetical protein